MIGKNLLPSHRRRARHLRRCMNAWAMALSCLALLAGGAIVGSLVARPTPPVMPAALMDAVERDRSALEQLRQAVRTLTLQARAHDRALAVPRWDALLDVLAGEVQGSARLQAIRIEPIQGQTHAWTVSVAGTTQTRHAPAQIAGRLERTGLFASVRHGLGAPTAGGGSWTFFLECALDPGGTP